MLIHERTVFDSVDEAVHETFMVIELPLHDSRDIQGSRFEKFKVSSHFWGFMIPRLEVGGEHIDAEKSP